MKFLQDKPQENKIKYECIKQELRQGYDKKVGDISKKLSKTQDGSFSLMMLTSPKTTTEDKTFATLLKETQCPTIDHIAKQLQRRDVISAKTRLRSADSLHSHQSSQKTLKKSESQQKSDYYKFYLQNAQKAIDMMIV